MIWSDDAILHRGAISAFTCCSVSLFKMILCGFCEILWESEELFLAEKVF